MSKMTVEEILNEVRKQQWEMNSTRYAPDATLFISEDCWITLLDKMPYEVVNIAAGSGAERCLMGYTTIVVKDVEQYVELKENARYVGMAGGSPHFDEWGWK